MIIAAPSISREYLASVLRSNVNTSDVHLACSGWEGLSLIERQKPDLVLIDSDLPGLSGMAITAVVRRDLPDVAVVLLTRFADYDWLLESARCGASTALTRDSDAETILSTIEGALEQRAKLFPWAVFDEEIDRGSFGGGWKRDRIDHVLTWRAVRVLDCLVLGLNLDEMRTALRTTKYGVRKAIAEVVAAMGVNGRIPAIVSAIERGWCTVSAQSAEITVLEPGNEQERMEVHSAHVSDPVSFHALLSEPGYAVFG